MAKLPGGGLPPNSVHGSIPPGGRMQPAMTAENLPPGVSGLIVPAHLAKQAQESQKYEGMLTGAVLGDPAVMAQPGAEKAFMSRLEALMLEFHIHKLDIFWSCPVNMGSENGNK